MDVRVRKPGRSTSVFVVVLAYASLASLWILLSDRAMALLVSDPAMLVQVGMAFVSGTALFVSLMATGSLLVCVLLHAFWDLGTLGTTATGRSPGPAQVVAAGVAEVAGVAALWPVLSG